jgi:ABC-2 type transport system ATP-binding protein
MDEDTAIVVSHVSKDFVLPHEKISSVKSAFTGLHKKKQKSSETQHALKDINFEVQKGEFFGIVGRNGSGKSTLLKILAGIYQPSDGSVQAKGKLVPFIELGVGFNPELTGRENVYLNGAMLGFSDKEVSEMYTDIVQFAELERFMDQKLKNYSSGMQVRLAFSLATRSDADILLVDEVLAVGDADFQRKCFNYFKHLKKEKKTVVFVSHDMNAVREYCDRAIFIEKSEIIREGNVAQVASSYTKMFIDDSEEVEQRINRTRWGDSKLKFTHVEVIPQTATAETEFITIEAEVEALQKVVNPIFGFTVKNGAGTEMLGSNTKLLHEVTGTLSKGSKRRLRWIMPNVLNHADYAVDVSAISDEDLSEYDWWESSTGFSVSRDEHTSYVIEPQVKVEIHDDK